MSIAVMNLVWQKSRAKGGELLLMIALADAADDRGFCRPHVPTLAKKARMSDRNVQLTRKSLEENGELEVQIGAGRGGANVYRIRLETLQAYPDDEQTQPCNGENSSPVHGEKISPGGEAHFTGGVKPTSPPSEPSVNHQNPLPPEPGEGEGEFLSVPELQTLFGPIFGLNPAAPRDWSRLALDALTDATHRVVRPDAELVRRAYRIPERERREKGLFLPQKLPNLLGADYWGDCIGRLRTYFGKTAKLPVSTPVHRDMPLPEHDPAPADKQAKFASIKAAVNPSHRLASSPP